MYFISFNAATLLLFQNLEWIKVQPQQVLCYAGFDLQL